MALRVSVTWPNAGSALLPESGANITLEADGSALPASRSAKGVREFDVPDGTATVKVTASFTASFGTVTGNSPAPAVAINAAGMSAEVLHAEQVYTVAGAALAAQTIPDFAGPHPLFVTKGAANQHGVVAITVHTEFVDIGAFWPQYCAVWGYYLGRHKKGTTTFVLGHTGGMPIVWFAIVPDAHATFSNAFTSCLVFYRPANYVYSRLDQPHQGAAVARYFLKPKADSDAGALDFERDHTPPSGYNLMGCRFEDSVVQSKRALVMLHPWPSGSDFGVATSAALPTLCEAAIRFLWAQKAICRNVGSVTLGRLGISAFSRGGDSLWATLANNVRRIREVYAFDCTGTAAAGVKGTIVQWFNSNDSNALRMVSGAYNFAAHAAIQRAISPSLAPRKDLTVVPPSVAEYAANNNSVWEHYISLAPFLRNDDDTRHQFTVCGGQMPFGKTSTYDIDDVETYLLNFLRASDFLDL